MVLLERWWDDQESGMALQGAQQCSMIHFCGGVETSVPFPLAAGDICDFRLSQAEHCL